MDADAGHTAFLLMHTVQLCNNSGVFLHLTFGLLENSRKWFLPLRNNIYYLVQSDAIQLYNLNWRVYSCILLGNILVLESLKKTVLAVKIPNYLGFLTKAWFEKYISKSANANQNCQFLTWWSSFHFKR